MEAAVWPGKAYTARDAVIHALRPVAMVREFEALGVDLVVLDQAIDTTTPAGRLLFHVLASISEFERDLNSGSGAG